MSAADGGARAVDALRTMFVSMDRKEFAAQVLQLEEELAAANAKVKTLERELERSAIDGGVLKYLTKTNHDLDKKCEAALRMANHAWPGMEDLVRQGGYSQAAQKAKAFMEEWERSKSMFVQIPIVDGRGSKPA